MLIPPEPQRSEYLAAWRSILHDYVASNHWPGVDSVALAPIARENCYIINPYKAESLTLFGIPVRIDPTIPASELRLDANGETIRIINLGS